MKKFLTVLAISTAVLSTVIISQGLSHQIRRCRQNHCLKLRPTTNRIFSYDQYHFQRKIARLRRIAKNEGNKFAFWINYNKQIQQPFNRKRYAEYRASHSTLFPRNNNLLKNTHKVSVRETAYHQNFNYNRNYELKNNYKKEFFSASTNNYKIKIPVDFTKSDNGKFYDKKRDFTLNIENSNGKFCENLTFRLCASQKGSKTREKMNLKNVKKLSQKFGLKQMLVNGKTLLIPTYRESFVAGEYGVEKVYFFYTIMNSYNENVVTLYGTAPEKYHLPSSNLLNSIFRTIKL
jgi:hypothetical protein